MLTSELSRKRPNLNKMQAISLIGMPGCGKSSIGVLLAKELCLDFFDTDVLIQIQQDLSLQKIIEQRGYLQLRQIEEQTLLGLRLERHVIATGGSAVYSEKGIAHLTQNSIVVYLDTPLLELQRRLGDYSHRGIASSSAATFESIFAERCPLYRQVADLTVDCQRLTTMQVLTALLQLLPSSFTLT